MKIIYLAILSFLFFSCERHQQEKQLLEKQAVEQFNLDESDKLFKAVIDNDFETLKLIIEKNEVDINKLNSKGENLLIEAVKLQRFIMTKYLIEKGADPEIKDVKKISAFFIIDSFEEREIWEKVLRQEELDQAFLNAKLYLVVTKGAQDIQEEMIIKMKFFLSLGASINTRVSEKGFTLLMNAANKNLPQIVIFICEQPDINLYDEHRRHTALTLTKRLAKRRPELKQIVKILENYYF